MEQRNRPGWAHEHELAVIVAAAGAAYARDDRRAFGAAVDRMLHLPDVDGWRALVTRELAARLRAGLAALWAAGWQPADLLRQVNRRLGTGFVRLAGALVAEDLAAYPAVTVDPRWFAQLREFDVAPSHPNLQALVESRGGGWVTGVPTALELLCLIRGLFPIERIGPVPGEYRPPAGDVPEVDPKVLALIRGLLAKAEATTSPAEAEAFMAGAQQRMARYSIDLAMLAATDPARASAPVARRIGVDNPYESAKVTLLASVAGANRCRTVWNSSLGSCTVVGFEIDLLAVEALFTSLLVQAVAAMNRAGPRTGPGGRSRTRGFRRSFLIAYAARIGERLAEVTQAQAAAAGAEPGGANVLPVLAARHAEVDDAYAQMFPDLRTRRVGAVSDVEGWHSGRGAADLADLRTGEALPRSS